MSLARLEHIAVQLRLRLRGAESILEGIFGRAGGTVWAMPAAIAFAAATLWIADSGLTLLSRSFDDVSFAHAIARGTRELRLALVDAETGQLGYTLTGDKRYLDPYTLATARLPQIRAELAQLARADREGRTFLKDIETNLDRILGHWQITIDMVRKGDPLRAQAIIQTGRGKEIMDELRGDMNWLERLHESRLARFEEVWGHSVLAVRVVLTVLIVAIVGLFLLVLRYAHRALETERQQKSYVEDERDRLERAVRERTRELSELAGHLQRAQEQERSRVARELHDEMGALLTASKMTVAWLMRQGQHLPPGAKEKLLKLDTFLEQGVQLKRRVIEGLSPSTLSNLGLNAALQDLVEQFAATGGVRAVFRPSGEHPDPTPETAVAIYRAAQEALTNVQKHAQATETAVELDSDPDWIELRVRDNGPGFAGDAFARGKVHGLRGMRQRAESLGGALEVASVPGQGTRLTFRVPRTPPAAE